VPAQEEFAQPCLGLTLNVEPHRNKKACRELWNAAVETKERVSDGSVSSILHNDAVSFWDYMASVVCERMSIEHWWNDADRGEPKFKGENQSQLSFLES
jgi:hypothetical protein